MSDPYYQTKQWKILRNACLRRSPICETPGCNELAVVADHIVLRRDGGPDVLDNLAGRCIRCHNSRKGTPQPRLRGADINGDPLDPTHWWNA